MKSFVTLTLLATIHAIRLEDCNCGVLAGVGTITIPGDNPCTADEVETEYFLNDACSAGGGGSTTIELNNNCGFGSGTITADNTVENICEPL